MGARPRHGRTDDAEQGRRGAKPCAGPGRTNQQGGQTRQSEDTNERRGRAAAQQIPALASGKLLAEINNRIVALTREHYGRGPTKAKTYVLDDLIVCVLRDGLTPLERTIMEATGPDRVLAIRRDFQRAMRAQYSEMIDQLTGRKVLAYISQVHMEPDLTVQTFVIDGPVPGYGALELVHPEEGQTGEMLL
jgi:uncharacterized protein YbcI